MLLSKRLMTVANCVTKGNRVADIGCDHAYTSIYLIKEQIATHVIAMDINKGPLERANANIRGYRMQEQIETRQSNGAKGLQVGEVDTLLISGMGGALMVNILSERKDVFFGCREVVLQPQSEIHLIRRFLHDNGWSIQMEEMLKEDGKYYVIIKAVPGQEAYERDVFYTYGKRLIEIKHPVLREYLEKEKGVRMQIQSSLQEVSTEKSRARLHELTKELNSIEEALGYYR